jgi:hypothetical protein
MPEMTQLNYRLSWWRVWTPLRGALSACGLGYRQAI